MTKIIINDYDLGREISLNLNNDDWNNLDNHWHKTDSLLIDLQSNSYFKGKTTWSELSPSHYRLLIIQTLSKITDVNNNDLDKNDAAKSLRFLLSCLIRCIERNACCEVELLKLGRIDHSNVLFDYVANMNVEFEKPESKFSVVVDNV